MKRATVRRITRDRLESWGEGIIKAHSTPYALLSVGHDHNAGVVTLSITEDAKIDEVASILFSVLEQLGYTRPRFSEPGTVTRKESDQ